MKEIIESIMACGFMVICIWLFGVFLFFITKLYRGDSENKGAI